MMDDLYVRKIGQTVLGVRAREGSTLAGGRARAASGYATTYDVVAYATRGRESTIIGRGLPTLKVATEYADAYSLSFGLIGKTAGRSRKTVSDIMGAW